LAVLAAISFEAVIAQANSVSFDTTGNFNGSGNSITFGAGADTLQINFTGVSMVSLNDTPFTFTSLGQFQTVTTGAGATITSGTTFTLTINQSAPTPGMDDLSATLTGSLKQNQSTSLVTFSISSVTIGQETYDLMNNPLPLVPPATNNGFTSVQARITGPAAVPEGGHTALLLGASMLALAATRRLWRTARV
jgi:hypothetical protein